MRPLMVIGRVARTSSRVPIFDRSPLSNCPIQVHIQDRRMRLLASSAMRNSILSPVSGQSDSSSRSSHSTGHDGLHIEQLPEADRFGIHASPEAVEIDMVEGDAAGVFEDQRIGRTGDVVILGDLQGRAPVPGQSMFLPLPRSPLSLMVSPPWMRSPQSAPQIPGLLRITGDKFICHVIRPIRARGRLKLVVKGREECALDGLGQGVHHLRWPGSLSMFRLPAYRLTGRVGRRRRLKRPGGGAPLGQQSCYRSGEHIAHPAAGHTRVACRIDPDRALRVRDQCPGAFEDDMDLVL